VKILCQALPETGTYSLLTAPLVAPLVNEVGVNPSQMGVEMLLSWWNPYLRKERREKCQDRNFAQQEMVI
jgi:hypothetical protein